ncbi:hypothetical protein OCOJLMKI_5291 [Methylobacterium iners]|uniref:Uncharacterized protein n=1 Tax=Methylobacterium iners TaxID=418707 RepID=A0ABQ4S8F9_9HYPH|nr:hypothetical protein OCOJLMKI_5291 [Methylobacterium iners]
MRTEPAGRALLQGQQHLVAARQVQDQGLVQRLGKARIGHRDRHARRLQLIGRLQGLAKPRAERQQRHPRAGCRLLGPAHDAAAPDRQGLAALGQLHPHPLAAGIAQRDRARVMGVAGGHHVHELGLVGGRHHGHVGQAAQVGEIERARMGGAVRAHQTRPVQAEAHGQVLQRDIVHDLVIGPLQEGRVDRHERLVALGGEPARKRDGVLLGDADVEGAGRVGTPEQVDAGAAGHGGCDRHHLGIGIRRLDQALAEHPRVGRGVGLGLGLDAGDHVELDHAVVAVGAGFRRCVALALLGDDVQQDRALVGVPHVAQHRQQVVEVVPVDRADIVEAHLLEHRARAHDQAAGELLGLGRALVEGLGQKLAQLLGGLAQRAVGAARGQPGEVGRHGAHRGGDRHVVVVEDDDEARVLRAGIVHGLVGHARRHRAVADHRHDIAAMGGGTALGLTLRLGLGRVEVASDRHAEARRDRGGGVGRAEGIVGALGALGEARQAAALAQRPDAVAASGEDLVGVGLVADVPDQAVVGGVEHVVQRHRQLDDAQARAEVPARDRDRLDHLRAHRLGHARQRALRQSPQRHRLVQTIQNRIQLP